MRKSIFLSIFLFVAFVSANAQDVILKTDKSIILAVVQEINETEVLYKDISNPKGDVSKESVKNILKIKFANGSEHIFNQEVTISQKSPDVVQGVLTQNEGVITDESAGKMKGDGYKSLSFWGFGGGYAYEFPMGGESSQGMHGLRIPLYFNTVFKKVPLGIFGLVGYEFTKMEQKVNMYSTKYKTTIEYTVHRIPVLAHMSLNFGDKSSFSVFLHAGPGLNILAGGQSKYLKNQQKTEYQKDPIDGGCDVTLGAGVGLNFKSLMVHVGFNGGLIKKSGVNQGDLDVSLMFAF